MKKFKLSLLEKLKLLSLKKSQLPLLFIVLMILTFADIATATYGLSIGGKESNPLFIGESFITRESLTAKISLTFVFVGIFIVTYGLCKKENFSKGLLLLSIQLIFLVGFYTGIVVGNTAGILITLIIQVL
ncbi:hypothetical protein KKA72_01615 [Patescibacteria group bacterium]|nr:hypothetical protein [Patescibacteria group bacterium]